MRDSENGKGEGGDEDAPSENTGRSYDRLDSADGSGGVVLRIGLTASVSKAFRATSLARSLTVDKDAVSIADALVGREHNAPRA